jgi:hypothetical protein
VHASAAGGDRLGYMALMALDEIAETCGAAPAERSLLLRFALAWLYEATGADPDKLWLYRDFWKAATRPDDGEYLTKVCRGTTARAALNGICREFGWEPTVSFLHAMKAARERRR